MGADDLAELAHALKVLANDLEYEGVETRETISGGYGSGYSLRLVCDPEMDHDRFAAENAEYVKASRG